MVKEPTASAIGTSQVSGGPYRFRLDLKSLKSLIRLSDGHQLEQRVKVEWREAKGFYWNDFLEEMGKYLSDEEDLDEEDIGAALCGLIKYKVKKLKDLKNISDIKK